MTYTKPQLTQIGSARTIIANPSNKNAVSGDSPLGNPAYDLDE
jgi:hypothetical protein